ncbi:glycine betaine ABC transporter substrate-binding protein [Halomonas halodenitrificans]|uniref:glycine betaine ABC transporter substrate-binding protein n=1 Tax=Halomonas halodenitrificans TaxID=28252 RepID=UPI000482451F|nr:glycine betaine ABC transporter substrate-binding protein [Halomonas halodenitrificans]
MNLPRRPITLALAGALLASPLALTAQADEPAEVRFSVPPWPGVTVKTDIAAQLLEALDYQVRQQELGSTITFEALTQGELDAFMGGWLPAQQGMYDTAMQSDNPLVDLGNNVDGARLGFAVPTYVHEAGFTSAEDLCSETLRDKAGGTLYSIEVGSGTSDMLAEMQDSGTYCLDEWSLSETSTPGMLSQARAAMASDDWIVFYAWTPHWMSIEYDIRFLEDPDDAWGPDGGRSDVKTLLTSRFADANPNAVRLLDQLVFSADDQSAMIYGFSFEEREPEAVALEWMRDNPERVEAFLDGVTTRDGSEDAWPVVQEALEIPDA